MSEQLEETMADLSTEFDVGMLVLRRGGSVVLLPLAHGVVVETPVIVPTGDAARIVRFDLKLEGATAPPVPESTNRVELEDPEGEEWAKLAAPFLGWFRRVAGYLSAPS